MFLKYSAILLTTICFTINAQAQFFIKAGASYHMPAFKTSYYDTVQPPNQPIQTGETAHSFASGIGWDLTPGFQFNKFLSAHVGLSYLPKQTSVETFFDANNRQRIQNMTSNGAIFITPGIGLSKQFNKFSVCGTAGVTIPLVRNIVVDEMGMGQINQNQYDYESMAEIKSKPSLGWNASAGAEYSLSKLFSLYTTFGVNNVSVNYDTKTVMGYFDRIQNQDITDQLSPSQREFVYVDAVGPQDNMDPNQPTKLLNQSSSFSSYAIAFGIKVKLGNNNNPNNALNKIDNKPVPPPPVVANKPCKDGDVEPLPGHAMKLTFQIPHPTKKPFYLIKTNLPRDKVPSAWNTMIQFALDALGARAASLRVIKTGRDVQNKKHIAAALKQLGWADKANVIGAEFIPPNMGGGGSPAAVVTFYLRALKAAITGITGLEKRISNMSVDLYFEIPVITVTGTCTPQKKCIRGKWYPDYNNLIWKETARNENGKIPFTKKDISYKDALKELEKKFIPGIEGTENDKSRLNSGDPCYDKKGALHSMKWPIKSDALMAAEAKLATMQQDLNKAIAKRDSLKKAYDEWRKKRRNYLTDLETKIATNTKSVKKMDSTLKAKRNRIKVLKNIMKNYENAGQTDNKVYKKNKAEKERLEKEVKDMQKERDKNNTKNNMDKQEKEDIDKRKKEKELKKQYEDAKKDADDKHKEVSKQKRMMRHLK